MMDQRNCIGAFGSISPPSKKKRLDHSETMKEKEMPISIHPDTVVLSESIIMFPSKKVGEHGNVCEGEIRSSVCGVRPCVIKFAELSEQNVREAEILTKLGSHTNIIAIIQSGTYCDVFDERVYIALDKCHHENLRQYLAIQKEAGIEFDLNQAIDFAEQIVAGVMNIHDNNVIHLDLKPSNILISQNLRLIKIADFGLSIVVKSPKSKLLHNHQFGTNGYRPIESFGNGEVSQRTDIFSLGTVLLHLLSNGNDVFGRDEHAFIHNVMNDITDTTGLLVPNPNTTEHLIKCMVSKERCHRPNIWEVSNHPCWSGKEMKCQFEYYAEDEINDNSDEGEIIVKENMKSLPDVKQEKQFLQKMREMGFNRKPAIIVFDNKSKYLHRFDHRNNLMTKIREFPDGVPLDPGLSSVVSIGEYIYVFVFGRNRSVSRLEYGDETATWTRMCTNDRMEVHQYEASAVASTNSIFFVGGWQGLDSITRSRSVSMYDPSSDEWKRMKDKPSAVLASALLSLNGFLYCCGGEDETGITNKIERMDLNKMEWTQLRNMNKRKRNSSASEFNGNIYVLGGRMDAANSAEMYKPEIDQWTNMKPMHEWHFNFKSFWIDGNLFAVGGLGAHNSIDKYDPVVDEWKIVARFTDKGFYESVLVLMSPNRK